MILYLYECSCGNRLEKFLKLDQLDTPVTCPECGQSMRRVPSVGGIECDSETDVKWLASAREVLQPDGEKPITTRGEWKKYIKKHGYIPVG